MLEIIEYHANLIQKMLLWFTVFYVYNLIPPLIITISVIWYTFVKHNHLVIILIK